MWQGEMYYGTKRPDAFEKILLEAHARIHWLAIETQSNLRAIESEMLSSRPGNSLPGMRAR